MLTGERAQGEVYFTENRAWYDLYINNCQLFVHFSIKRIAALDAVNPKPAVNIDAPENTISGILLLAAFTIVRPFALLELRWLAWRGCDEKNLQAYAALVTYSITMLPPSLIMVFTQQYYLLASIFEQQPLFVAILTTLMTAALVNSTTMTLPLLTFPRARRRADGTWKVSTRMKQNNEEIKDAETEIRVEYPFIVAFVGACIGLSLWVYIVLPIIFLEVGGDRTR